MILLFGIFVLKMDGILECIVGLSGVLVDCKNNIRVDDRNDIAKKIYQKTAITENTVKNWIDRNNEKKDLNIIFGIKEVLYYYILKEWIEENKHSYEAIETEFLTKEKQLLTALEKISSNRNNFKEKIKKELKSGKYCFFKTYNFLLVRLQGYELDDYCEKITELKVKQDKFYKIQNPIMKILMVHDSSDEHLKFIIDIFNKHHPEDTSLYIDLFSITKEESINVLEKKLERSSSLLILSSDSFHEKIDYKKTVKIWLDKRKDKPAMLVYFANQPQSFWELKMVSHEKGVYVFSNLLAQSIFRIKVLQNLAKKRLLLSSIVFVVIVMLLGVFEYNKIQRQELDKVVLFSHILTSFKGSVASALSKNVQEDEISLNFWKREDNKFKEIATTTLEKRSDMQVYHLSDTVGGIGCAKNNPDDLLLFKENKVFFVNNKGELKEDSILGLCKFIPLKEPQGVRERTGTFCKFYPGKNEVTLCLDIERNIIDSLRLENIEGHFDLIKETLIKISKDVNIDPNSKPYPEDLELVLQKKNYDWPKD